jgi:hypothetical protein
MTELICLLKLIGVIFSITFIWFQTNAFYEYFCWLPFKFIKDYKDFLSKESDTFINFLRYYRCNFLIRLVTCPACFMAWVSIFCGVFTDYTLIPVAYTASLILLYTVYGKKF